MTARILSRADRDRTHAEWKAAWMFVGAAFQNHSEQCADCPHRVTHEELRPYGEGSFTVYEDECTLNAFPNRMPDQCPAYAQSLIEQTA